MSNRPFLAVLALGCLVTAGVRAEEPSTDRVRTSRHLTEAILAGYRRGEPEPAVPAADAPTDVEAGTVILPTMEVRTSRGSAALKAEDLTPRSEAIPLVAGTGVTEIKGPHRTILIRRLFFIPVGFKLSW